MLCSTASESKEVRIFRKVYGESFGTYVFRNYLFGTLEWSTIFLVAMFLHDIWSPKLSNWNWKCGIMHVWFVYFDESGFVISKIWGNQEVHDGSLHPSLHRRTSPKLAKKSLWLELTGLFCTSHCTSIVNYMSSSQRFTICTYSNFIPSHVLIHPICNFIFLTMHHYIILSK